MAADGGRINQPARKGLSAQMTKSLGKSVINLYLNIAYSALGVGNQQDLSKKIR